MYPVEKVAEYIIMKCNSTDKTISNLKLQKILYFVQAEFLVKFDHPCFKEEIEAWDFGPVVPIIYHLYKKHGGAHIPFLGEDEEFPFSDKAKERIDSIISECSKYTASQLVDITHHQSPWMDAYEPCRNNIISKKSIKSFFKED